jgi:SAM-dependent methyltransferase
VATSNTAPPAANGPDRDRALAKYAEIADRYDRRMRFSESARRAAIGRLRLRPGDAVLDVACGTGINFSLLEEALRMKGRIIGIEQSPRMIAVARQRPWSESWPNIELIESSVEEADIPALADAALFSFTHDVLRSPEALSNVVTHLKLGARVAAVGSKWAPPWAFPVSAVVWAIARRYVTTFEGFRRPWDRLADLVGGLHVESIYLGGGYIAWGTLSAERAAGAGGRTA